MNLNEIKEKLKEGWKLIDIRTIEEHNKINHSDAKHIPIDIIFLNNHNLKKDEKYLLFCKSGLRSQKAESYLKMRGYNVINVGGLKNLGLI